MKKRMMLGKKIRDSVSPNHGISLLVIDDPINPGKKEPSKEEIDKWYSSLIEKRSKK